VWIHWQTPSWSSRRAGGSGSGQGYQEGRGSMLVFEVMHECGVPVGRVCACSMWAASTQLDQPVSRGPARWVRGDRIRAGVLGRKRGCAGAWGIRECACACEPGECGVCAATATFCLRQPRNKTSFLILSFKVTEVFWLWRHAPQ